MSLPSTVLISGVNGFVATDIAHAFLKAGYRVRGTVRTESKAKAWLTLPAFVEYASSGQVECILVPQITSDTAFVAALEGVDYFIHTIAQLPDWRPGVQQNYEKDILDPNINGTLAALRSAALYPKCKKVIILGSISGAVDFSVSKHDSPITGKSWNPRDFEYGKNAPHPLLAYTTSKKLADEAAWKWMEENKPHFALVNLLPGFVYGPSHGHDPFGVNNSSQQWLAGALFKKDWNFKTATGGPTLVDLRDVSLAFVKAVERDEANGQRFVMGPSGVSIFPSDFIALFAKVFPERATSLPPVPEDLVNAPVFTIDSSDTEEKLGITFRPVEETIIDTAKWLISSGAEEGWAAVEARY